MRPTLRLGLASAAAALIMTSPAPAPAAAGKLDSPGVAFAASYPAAAQAKVMKALKRPDCKFLGGTWINSWTTLRYRGDVWALNEFVGELVKCPGVTVHVSLKRLPDDADWRVGHSAHQNRFQVEVNLNSKRVDLEKLYIPEFAGPDLRKEVRTGSVVTKACRRSQRFAERIPGWLLALRTVLLPVHPT